MEGIQKINLKLPHSDSYRITYKLNEGAGHLWTRRSNLKPIHVILNLDTSRNYPIASQVHKPVQHTHNTHHCTLSRSRCHHFLPTHVMIGIKTLTLLDLLSTPPHQTTPPSCTDPSPSACHRDLPPSMHHSTCPNFSLTKCASCETCPRSISSLKLKI
jgi:hypothetical protein